jgi:hypothetical protein
VKSAVSLIAILAITSLAATAEPVVTPDREIRRLEQQLNEALSTLTSIQLTRSGPMILCSSTRPAG